MKPVGLALCLIASSAFAQDRLATLATADSAGQQTYIRARSIKREEANPAIRRLKGDVQIATKHPSQNSAMLVKADEAVYHSDTGEIEPLDNVRVRLITQ